MEIFLFNWNGTLVDDLKIWYSTIVRVFRHFGVEPPTIEEYFSIYRGDYLDIYRQKGIVATREETTAVYIVYYKEALPKISLFAGAKEIILELKEANKVLGLVTGQPKELVVPALERFGLSSCFSHLCFYPQNKARAILKILEIEKKPATDCCYVSHTLADIIVANQVGIVSVAFLNEYLPETLVEGVEPKYKIKSLEDLANL